MAYPRKLCDVLAGYVNYTSETMFDLIFEEGTWKRHPDTSTFNNIYDLIEDTVKLMKKNCKLNKMDKDILKSVKRKMHYAKEYTRHTDT